MEEKKSKMTKREWKIFIIGMISIVTSLYLFYEIIYLKTQSTCAQFNDEYETRGIKYIEYMYRLDDKKYKNAVVLRKLKIKNLDDLKQYDCIEIEHSVWFPSYSRVVDKRILK